VGVENVREEDKFTGRKMPENSYSPHPSSAPTKSGLIYHKRNRRRAIGTVYSEAASTQAEQSSGERLVRLPRCTMVSGQIDLPTGGVVGDPDEKANSLK